MSRQSHSFAVEHAELYGVECAILINHFQFWIEHNQAMQRNFHDDRTWMYQTQKEMAAIYPYWSEDTVFRLIKKLLDEGVLIKGNYNRTAFDKTSWYAFKNEIMFTKPRIRGMDSTTPRNQSREVAVPIPDTKTDTETKIVCASQNPVDFSKHLKNHEEVEKQNCSGGSFKISKEELFIRCIKERMDWSEVEIDEVWEILKNHAGGIRDWFKFCSQTIINRRKMKGIKEYNKKQDGKCQDSNINPSKKSLKTIKEPISEKDTLVRPFADWKLGRPPQENSTNS